MTFEEFMTELMDLAETERNDKYRTLETRRGEIFFAVKGLMTARESSVAASAALKHIADEVDALDTFRLTLTHLAIKRMGTPAADTAAKEPEA